MASEVPQGSMLGSVLLLEFINDIDDGLLNSVLKFADDTMLLWNIARRRGWSHMQSPHFTVKIRH